MSPTPPDPVDGPATPRGPQRPADRVRTREDLWLRGRTYATATWSLPAFIVLVPGVVVPLVAGGEGVLWVTLRVAAVLLLLIASALLARRRGHGVVRGLAVGLLVATAVLGVAIPLGMLVRAVIA